MKQSYRASMIETVTGTLAGFVVAVLANLWILPWFGFPVSLYDSAALGVIFTALSLVRGILVRRFFEALRTNGVLP